MGSNSMRTFHHRDELMAYFRDTISFSQASIQSIHAALDSITSTHSIAGAVISDEDCKRLLEKGFYSSPP
jgi:hypothetical protein